MERSIVTRAGLGIASLALGILLVFNFKAPEDVAAGGATAATGTGSGSRTGTGTGSASASASGTGPTAGGTVGASSSGSTSCGGSTSGGATSGSKTVDVSLINTRYGSVQVEITVSNGKLASVTAIELPSGGRSGMISAYVEPVLSGEALTAQSAQIDLVSGATYTSTAYERSLQAALDKAGL